MLPKQTSNFVDQISLKIQQYQHEKAIRLDRHQPGPSYEQSKAKQTLIDLDEEQTQPAQNADDDVIVGRWSNYRVPTNIEERLSIGKKSRRKSLNPPPTNRYLEYSERNYLPTICRSQKTIPKLKVILHQLECPLNVSSEQKKKQSTHVKESKMRNHIGMQALVISNRQQIKPTIKSQRKSTLISDFGVNGENQRPPTSHFKATSTSSSYQKIKRTIGSSQDCELVYQKQILSQLIKGNLNRANQNQLSNMMNFFSITNSKKKGSTKLGLDKLLS